MLRIIVSASFLLIAGSFANGGAFAATPATHVIGVRPEVGSSRDFGPASAQQSIAITVTYAHRHENELASLIAGQTTPGSPLRGHFVTPRQFDAYFGPSPASVSNVERSFEAAGFRPASRATASVERFVGTIQHADALFSTRIDSFAQARAGMRYGNVSAARVPAAIARDVVAVTGLDNFARPRDPRSTQPAPAAAVRGAFVRSQTSADVPLSKRCKPAAPASTVDLDQPQVAANGNVGYGPATFESDFDLPIERGCGGAGFTVAILNSGDAPLVSDVDEFLAYFDITRTLPPYTTRTVNASTYTDIFESTLDTDVVASLAPDANVVIYMTDDTLDGVAEAMNAVAADNTAAVLTTSYNDCESFGQDVYAAENSAAEQLAAQGITTIADAGDTGYESCFFNPGIATPGDSPYVVAVGGVQPLAAATAYRSVSGWSGSSGGTSQFAAKPLYQYGIKACSGTYRCVPDIALASGTGTYPVASTATEGVFDFVNGVSNAVSGTSESAPMFAAMQVEADQFAGRRMGAVNPILYADYYLLGSTHPLDPLAIFTDVTAGTSGTVTATHGWDFITGLGVPDGVKLAAVESL